MTRLALALLLLAGPALGHDWYDRECCHSQDCKPVDEREIGEAGGLYIYQGMTFPKRDARASADKRYHVCVAENGMRRFLRCVYSPAPGS